MEPGLPKDYRPSEDEPYMNPRQLAYFRQKLLAWRDSIVQESAAMLNIVKKTSLKAPDDADQGRLEADNTLTLRNSDRNRKLLYKIDEALERIKNGTYGYCEETGEEIGIKRLEIRPVAALSIEAQKKHEQMERLTRGRTRR